ncbi:uncharacterized protein LOC34621284 [Cyclospora cayetanensis]|uniref:Uncharacterized protein LOC34621284 n=1 Tax=Cyclospora cayetanensis TaxID=88456 RepID=A0A6P6S1V9_9EIME|nr:uncharacterized protein LOC34621284 [Cyclospora cayetanensis]
MTAKLTGALAATLFSAARVPTAGAATTTAKPSVMVRNVPQIKRPGSSITVSYGLHGEEIASKTPNAYCRVDSTPDVAPKTKTVSQSSRRRRGRCLPSLRWFSSPPNVEILELLSAHSSVSGSISSRSRSSSWSKVGSSASGSRTDTAGWEDPLLGNSAPRSVGGILWTTATAATSAAVTADLRRADSQPKPGATKALALSTGDSVVGGAMREQQIAAATTAAVATQPINILGAAADASDHWEGPDLFEAPLYRAHSKAVASTILPYMGLISAAQPPSSAAPSAVPAACHAAIADVAGSTPAELSALKARATPKDTFQKQDYQCKLQHHEVQEQPLRHQHRGQWHTSETRALPLLGGSCNAPLESSRCSHADAVRSDKCCISSCRSADSTGGPVRSAAPSTTKSLENSAASPPASREQPPNGALQTSQRTARLEGLHKHTGPQQTHSSQGILELMTQLHELAQQTRQPVHQGQQGGEPTLQLGIYEPPILQMALCCNKPSHNDAVGVQPSASDTAMAAGVVEASTTAVSATATAAADHTAPSAKTAVSPADRSPVVTVPPLEQWRHIQQNTAHCATPLSVISVDQKQTFQEQLPLEAQSQQQLIHQGKAGQQQLIQLTTPFETPLNALARPPLESRPSSHVQQEQTHQHILLPHRRHSGTYATTRLESPRRLQQRFLASVEHRQLKQLKEQHQPALPVEPLRTSLGVRLSVEAEAAAKEAAGTAAAAAAARPSGSSARGCSPSDTGTPKHIQQQVQLQPVCKPPSLVSAREDGMTATPKAERKKPTNSGGSHLEPAGVSSGGRWSPAEQQAANASRRAHLIRKSSPSSLLHICSAVAQEQQPQQQACGKTGSTTDASLAVVAAQAATASGKKRLAESTASPMELNSCSTNINSAASSVKGMKSALTPNLLQPARRQPLPLEQPLIYDVSAEAVAPVERPSTPVRAELLRKRLEMLRTKGKLTKDTFPAAEVAEIVSGTRVEREGPFSVYVLDKDWSLGCSALDPEWPQRMLQNTKEGIKLHAEINKLLALAREVQIADTRST